jgi:large subunit ribosomal protein L5
MKQRLNRFYEEQVIYKLRKQFNYRNFHQIPRVKKIVINRGIGSTIQNTNTIKACFSELIKITGQYCVATRARKAISGFKIRENMPVGIIVTLRGERIYAFLDRLVNLALPRIRDFQGVNPKSFDGHGNYNMGLTEQLIFPEISYDQIEDLCGINLSIVTTSPTDEEGLELLKRLGIPFQKDVYLLFEMVLI